MRLPRFTYERPPNLKGVSLALKDKPEAKVLAGGTDLLVNMKHRVETPLTLVALRELTSLKGIREEGGSVAIGAMTTLKELQDSKLVREKLSALADASMVVGSYRHQTMGTIAGNLCQNNRCRFFNQPWSWRQARSLCYKAGGEDCHVIGKKGVCFSAYSGDTAPALLVLDASLRIIGPEGERTIPLAQLYSGEGKYPLTLEKGEFVAEITVPREAAAGKSRYEKFAIRGAIDFPIVGAAVWHGGGAVRVAFTAVDKAPVRAPALEEFLAGKTLNEETIREAAALAGKAAKVAPTTIHPVQYKRDLMGSLFVKALRAIA